MYIYSGVSKPTVSYYWIFMLTESIIPANHWIPLYFFWLNQYSYGPQYKL